MRNCREPGTETESSEDLLAKLLCIFDRQVKAARAQPKPKETAQCIMSFNLPNNVVRYLDYLVRHGSHGTSCKAKCSTSRSSLIALAIEHAPYPYESVVEALERCKEWKADQGARLVSARLSLKSAQLLRCIADELGSNENPVSIKAAGEALILFWSQVDAYPRFEEVELMILQQSVPPLMRKRRQKDLVEPNRGSGRTARLVRRASRTPVGANS